MALATCDWGVGDPWTWAGKNAHAIMWRTAPDMLDSYQSLTDTVDMQLGLHQFAEQQGGAIMLLAPSLSVLVVILVLLG